jgi:hypothetical protein
MSMARQLSFALIAAIRLNRRVSHCPAAHSFRPAAAPPHSQSGTSAASIARQIELFGAFAPAPAIGLRILPLSQSRAY